MARLLFRSCLALALPLAAAGPLRAATPVTPATAKADIFHALSLQKLEDMEFGTIIVAGAGTAVIDPVANSLSTTGGAVAAGGTPHAASYRGAASQNAVVIIRVPKQPVTLTRTGGTETLMLSNFTLDGPSKRNMAQQTMFEFKVGGTLTIAAGQAEGDYVGTFEVTAQYP